MLFYRRAMCVVLVSLALGGLPACQQVQTKTPVNNTVNTAEKSPKQVELARRIKLAKAEIVSSYGTEAGEYGSTLFVDHHIQELEQSYWQRQLGVNKPTPAQVLSLIVLKSAWSDDDDNGIDNLDFSLPDDVTDSVI